ncbi:MAG TPA: thioesterase family protein [Candidatus Marinimicrobia bacterium]|jgi:acyl-CoA thioester hydrolase|nr:thioesterase family protein [Candidatus Neomarinimicrobiota bacterium]|tara:strand:+ start:156 stop:584 length:429 start_codon:yes stop_codon:yes gene_type:complete
MKEYRHLTRADFDHMMTIQTRWGDMDSLGHLNHAKYLTYMETARIDYYASLGFGGMRQDQDPSIILGGMTIDYIDQVMHPASLTVCHRINKVGTKSFDFLGAIFENGKDYPVCTGLFNVISFDYKSQQTVEVPQIIRDHLHG